MVFQYKCGHQGTEGLWADDFVVPVNYDCRACKEKALKPAFKSVKKGSKTLVLKKAHVAER